MKSRMVTVKSLILAFAVMLAALTTGCPIRVYEGGIKTKWQRKYCYIGTKRFAFYGYSRFKSWAKSRAIKKAKKQARAWRCKAIMIDYQRWFPYQYKKKRYFIKGGVCKCRGVEYL